MILSANSTEVARSQIEAGLNKMASMLGPPPTNMARNRGFIPGAQKGFAVVIDGDTLRYALETDLKPLFLTLGTQCETVVCCRVSPAQKALTVKLVRNLIPGNPLLGSSVHLCTILRSKKAGMP